MRARQACNVDGPADPNGGGGAGPSACNVDGPADPNGGGGAGPSACNVDGPADPNGGGGAGPSACNIALDGITRGSPHPQRIKPSSFREFMFSPKREIWA